MSGRKNYKICITSPKANEIVYPYIDKVYEYYTTEDADISDYCVAGEYPEGDGSQKDVVISWVEFAAEDNAQVEKKYVVEYGRKPDFSDALIVLVEAPQSSVGLRNLYKAADYYVRVTAYVGPDVWGQSDVVSFQTTDIGPRVMTVDGIYNVRDIGGYMTESGKRTVQGLLYRGSAMDGAQNLLLSKKGDDVMSKLMGIKYDMDLRAPHECNLEVTKAVSSAITVRHTYCGYELVFDEENIEKTRSVFRALANKDNYPLYFHCVAGADRTGTLAFLINGLCGVSEKELVQDYEFTSYSIFGMRTLSLEQDGHGLEKFLVQLKKYEGDTLSKKIENCLLSIGVTAEEIYCIRAIMLGESTAIE